MNEERLSQAAKRAKPDRQEEFMTTVAEQWIERGKAQGRVEGESEGTAKTIIAVLEARFGTLTEEQREHVRTLPIDELNALSRRAATARTLEAALGDAKTR
jgi:predicted transposase YdaD